MSLSLLGVGHSSAEWTPADIPQAIFWLPTYDLSRLWTDDGKTMNATAAGDEIFHADEAIAGKDCDAQATESRPILRSDGTRGGSLHFESGKTMVVQDSTTLFNEIHRNGNGAIMFWVKFDTAEPSESGNGMFGNASVNFSPGMLMYRDPAGNLQFYILTNSGSTTTIVSGGSAITNTNWHSVVVLLSPSANGCSMEIDDVAGDPWTFGGVSTEDAAEDLMIGDFFLPGEFPAECQISNLVICSSIPSSDDIDRWLAHNPPLA